MDFALCRETWSEAFFPEKGGSTREAKRICQGCEVRDECLEYAVAHTIRFGVWGGLSERERRSLYPKAPNEGAAVVAGKRRPSAGFYEERARQVHALAAEGLTTRQISVRLGISQGAAQRSLARRVAEEAA